MDLRTMCELLGVSVECKPILQDGETIGYNSVMYLDGGLWVQEGQAEQAVYDKLERMVLDIIRVNRNLSNEDLAVIYLNNTTKRKDNA